MSEGNSDLGKRHTSRDMANGVKKGRTKKCNNERFGDFGGWLKLKRPKE